MTLLNKELSHNDLSVVVDISPSKENIEYLWQGIRDYNLPFLGKYSSKSFIIYIKNQNEKIIAGIVAKLFILPYVDLNVIWVQQEYRKLGLGTLLHQKLEEFVKENGYSIIQLDTYSWQARPFYEKLGYRCVGTLPKWLFEFDRYFMQKELE